MTISPQEIQNREFREAFRGYNEDEVDTFLDEVAEEFGQLYLENQRLRIQLATLQQEAAQRGGMPAGFAPPAPAATGVAAAAAPASSQPRTDRTEAREEMRRALVATQRAAEAALDEAKRRAAEIISRAEHRAKEIDEMTARRATDVDADAGTALAHAQVRVEELRRQESEIRARLRRMLAEHVKVLQQLEGEAVAASVAPAVAMPPAVAPAQPSIAPPQPVPPAPSPPSALPRSDAPQAGPTAAADASRQPQARNPLWLRGRAGQQRASAPARGIGAKPSAAEPAEPAEPADPGAPADRRTVVDRMTRELGDAASPPAISRDAAGKDTTEGFWRK